MTPDRILIECEDIKDHTDKDALDGNYGFMLHVLDEENTVLTLIQEPVLGHKDCFKRQEEIEKILKSGKSIYIGSHGDLDDPREKGLRSYSTFPKRGTYYSNGRVLQLSVIKNEHEQCYSAHGQPWEPCMPPEFPIKK